MKKITLFLLNIVIIMTMYAQNDVVYGTLRDFVKNPYVQPLKSYLSFPVRVSCCTWSPDVSVAKDNAKLQTARLIINSYLQKTLEAQNKLLLWYYRYHAGEFIYFRENIDFKIKKAKQKDNYSFAKLKCFKAYANLQVIEEVIPKYLSQYILQSAYVIADTFNLAKEEKNSKLKLKQWQKIYATAIDNFRLALNQEDYYNGNIKNYLTISKIERCKDFCRDFPCLPENAFDKGRQDSIVRKIQELKFNGQNPIRTVFILSNIKFFEDNRKKEYKWFFYITIYDVPTSTEIGYDTVTYTVSKNDQGDAFSAGQKAAREAWNKPIKFHLYRHCLRKTDCKNKKEINLSPYAVSGEERWNAMDAVMFNLTDYYFKYFYDGIPIYIYICSDCYDNDLYKQLSKSGLFAEITSPAMTTDKKYYTLEGRVNLIKATKNKEEEYKFELVDIYIELDDILNGYLTSNSCKLLPHGKQIFLIKKK